MTESSDLRPKRMPPNHGDGHMHLLGFGTLIPDTAATMSAARHALEAGFRHFDCAEPYRNERAVGEALQAGLAAGGIAREDIFVTTKLWNSNHRPEGVKRLSRRVLTDSGSTIWISISFTLHLRFNRATNSARRALDEINRIQTRQLFNAVVEHRQPVFHSTR
jgi:diketogulonate reductase-like aldo/keto reductase